MEKEKFSTKNEKWFRLDNSATIYPMTLTFSNQSLYRLGVELYEYVDKEQLQNALIAILPRFPSLKVELRDGFFRNYFETIAEDPVVEEDNGVLLDKINFRRNKRYLFRVTYYKKKIFIDFFHALCDGTAGMEFLKSLTYMYLKEGGRNFPDTPLLKLPSQNVPKEELEDSFLTYYRKFKLFGGVIGKMTGKNAVMIKGKHFKKTGFGHIQGIVETSELLKLSKSYGATLTTFLSALHMFTVAELYCKEPQKYDLVAMIPLNLRKIFESGSMLNFTTITYNRLRVNSLDKNLKAYVDEMIKVTKEEQNVDLLRSRLSFTSFMDKYWFVKIMPLPLKSFVTRVGKIFTSNTKITAIVSNVGIVKLPDFMEQYVANFFFNLNTSKKAPNNMTITTYQNKTNIIFTRRLVHTEIEKRFFEHLTELGIGSEIVSNFREIRLKA